MTQIDRNLTRMLRRALEEGGHPDLAEKIVSVVLEDVDVTPGGIVVGAHFSIYRYRDCPDDFTSAAAIISAANQVGENIGIRRCVTFEMAEQPVLS